MQQVQCLISSRDVGRIRVWNNVCYFASELTRRNMERVVIINESTFNKWMERVNELLDVLHSQQRQVRNRRLGTWLDTSEVCQTLNLSKRTVQTMRERGELPYSKIEGKIYHRAEDIARLVGTDNV